jgi:HlyD family secretion protein
MSSSENKETPRPQQFSFSIKGHVFIACFVMAVLVFGIGAWAATAKLMGAVIASGKVVVDKNIKKVQHADGGIISKINVKNGDRVNAGDILLTIDDTQLKSNLAIITTQIIELTARSARLSATINSETEIDFSQTRLLGGVHVAKVTKAEQRLFEISQSHKKSQTVQLRSQIDQLKEEIKGILSQRNSKKSQLVLIKKELGQVKKLYRKNLTSVNRVYALEREEERISGEFGGLVAQIARTKGKISEIKLQILSLDENERLQAQKDLRHSESKLAELKEKLVASKDKLKRTNLIAPQTGIVHELSVHTIGGVITSAETVMVIVPVDERLKIQAKINPTDIDQVYLGRTARLRFSAFSQQTTPELDGHIVNIAADDTEDQKTGQSYYLAELEVDEQSKAHMKGLEIVPGMPVEVFISTGERTALSYLTKPFVDQIQRAFRE